jgi:cyclopropane fatty-acyl-phospholipid synthase-like methyltransferase
MEDTTYFEEDDLDSPFPQWLPGDSLAPPCQAELDVVEAILELAKPTEESFVFDLGCGDGRICIEATKRYGCRSLGYEIEDKCIEQFRLRVSRLDPDTAKKISIRQEDLRNASLDEATIICLYLLYESIESIKPKLIEAVKRGAILVCNTWGPKGLIPTQKITCGFSNNVTLLKYDKSSLPPELLA